ncbi:unnamed protein product [Fusarium graminearum]|nr:unnamed protein product [Fusarium graminearum]CAG1976198.1 unnamed protein product [Fusarium graminearum]CZS77294.1 unnamed protein product [Fusarium graminearum]VTO87645.1 unnamed protein product [Fusarium graminearum]
MRKDTSQRRGRQTHRKSRGGCMECKRRHIKCGEEKPQCRSCVIRNLSCLYRHDRCSSLEELHTTKAARLESNCEDVSSTMSEDNRSLSVPTSLDYLTATSDVFSLHELDILHHWTTTTSQLMCTQLAPNQAWAIKLPQLGFQYPFVLYGILSLASLQRALSDPKDTEGDLAAATNYHASAVQSLLAEQATTCQHSDKTIDAMFAFSIIDTIYVLATYGTLSRQSEPTSRPSRVLELDWIRDVRSVRALLKPFNDKLREGCFDEFANLKTFEDWDMGHGSVRGDDGLLNLRASYQGCNSSDIELYNSTVKLLRRCRPYKSSLGDVGTEKARLSRPNPHWITPLIFLQEVPEEFIDRLYQRQPPALLILSFFGAMLSAYDTVWFMDGWALEIVSAVDYALGDYWAPYTTWCREQVAMNFVRWDSGSEIATPV